MPLPEMDSDPTAMARVPGAQPVTTTTSVREARAHLHSTGETAAVVYRHGRPDGVVTAAALARAAESKPPETPVDSVMDYVAVPVDRRHRRLASVRAAGRTARRTIRERFTGT